MLFWGAVLGGFYEKKTANALEASAVNPVKTVIITYKAYSFMK
jgi:hypothetical protein